MTVYKEKGYKEISGSLPVHWIVPVESVGIGRILIFYYDSAGINGFQEVSKTYLFGRHKVPEEMADKCRKMVYSILDILPDNFDSVWNKEK